MRLNDLFEQIINEAPGDLTAADRRTMLISPAEIYQMTGQTPPQIKGPNGRMIQPPGWYDKVEMPIGGPGGINPKIATAHKKWVEGGRVPGLIWDADKQGLKPYNENNILEDLGWQIAAGAVETASAITKGGAKVIDDVMSIVTLNAEDTLGQNKLLKKTMATSKIVDGKREYDEFVLDDLQKWLESKTDQQFRDNMDATAGAVNSFGDIGNLFMGGIPGGWEGALGIMASELPSEILDIGLMVAGGGYGLAASGALNALEAGGAAASEIQKRIDTAYDKGILQQQPQYQVMFEAAQQQLANDENFDGTDEELNARAANMAREQLTNGAINRAFYAVAAVGGVLDTVQNKIIYGGPIKPNFLKNAFAKAIIAPGTEAVSEMGEQWMQNLGIRDAAGNIVQPGEGVVNAGWNGWIAGHTATVVGTTADAIGGGNRMQKAARARLRQFFIGGSKDVEALVDVMNMDSNTLITNATDSEGKLRLAEMVDERGLKTMKDLSRSQQRRLSRTGRVEIDGETYTRKQLEKNTKSRELLQLLSDVDIDPNENIAVVTFKDDSEIRRTAELLGIDSKGSINKVMAELEEVRKMDVRIAGRSKLEAPVWSELNERQQQEYIQTGTIKFVGDPERGTQTWTRQQIMFNSRRNQDEVPAEIANMLDNVEARPTMDPEDQREINSQQALIDGSPAMFAARQSLEADQKEWDAEVEANGEEATIAEFGPRPSEDMEGDPYNFTGARASTMVSQRTIDQIKKNLADAQAQWDQQNGDTHTTDGVVIVTRPKETKPNPKFISINTDIPGGSDPEAQDDADSIDIDTTITPDDLTGDEDAPQEKIVPPVVVTTDIGDSLSRAHVVANAKIAIANGDMDPVSVNAMIESLETRYPGINTEILPDGIDSYKQNPNEQVKKIQDETKENIVPEEAPRNGKPPKGSIATVDGQQYKFLGAMWAPIKPDGSLGSTGHQNHKRLMDAWSDSIIDTTAPGPLQAPMINPDGSIDDSPPQVDNTTPAEPGPEVDTTPPQQPSGGETELDAVPDTPGTETPPVSQTPPAFDSPSDEQDPLNIDTTTPPAPSNRPDALDLPGTSAPDPDADTGADTGATPTTGSGRGDGQAELDARRQKAKDDKEKADADAEADADNIDLDTGSPEDETDNTGTTNTRPDALDLPGTSSDQTNNDAPEVDDTPPEQPKLGDTPKLDTVVTAEPDDPIKFVEPSKLDPSKAEEVPEPIDPEASPVPDQNNRPDALDLPSTSKDEPKNTRPDALDLPSTSKDDEKTQVEPEGPEQPKEPEDQDPDTPGYQSKPDQSPVTTEPDAIVDPSSTPVILPKVDTKTDTKTKPDTKVTSKDQQQTGKKKKPRVGFAGGKDKSSVDYYKPNFDLSKFPDILKLNRNVGLARRQAGTLDTGLKKQVNNTIRNTDMRFKNILKPPHLGEGYKIMPPMDKEKYPEMPGLEGPFTMMSGKVVYYDPKEGAYYDKDADMYMSYDEFQQHDNDYGDMKDERDEVKKEADELNIGAKGDRPYKAPRQPKRGDPINPKSKGVDPKVLNMFLTNSITEGEMSDLHAMISNADNPEEMVMDLVDKGGPQGQFLYSELEQLATEAGTTFNNAESLPEDFVDELLANMGIEGYTFESDVYPPRGDMEMDPSNMRSSGAPKSSPRPKPRPMRVPRPKPRPTTRIGGMPDGSTRGIDPKDNYSPEDLKRLLMQSAMSEMEEAGNEEEGMIIYVGDQKFEYYDYTLEDAMRIVDEYADEMDGEPYEVYNVDGKLVSSGTMRSGAFHEPGIEEGHSPHKKGTKKYKAHMAAMHANEDVDQQYADILKSKNQIKINAFLQGLDPATATRLTGGQAQTSKISSDGQSIGPSGDIYKHGEPGLSKQTIRMTKPVADRKYGESKRKVSINQVCEAVNESNHTYAVAKYVRTTLDPSYETWDQVYEQVEHIISCINEGKTVNANTVMQLLSRQNLQEKADKEMMRKENIDSLRKIVNENTAMPIKFRDGSIKVDTTTASVFLEVFNKQKETKQQKIAEEIQTKSGFLNMLELMYKKIG